MVSRLRYIAILILLALSAGPLSGQDIAFRKSSTLVIVWCNLFADTDKIYEGLQNLLKEGDIVGIR